MGLYLHAKFQVSSIILMSFRQGGEGATLLTPPRPPSKQTSKEPTQIRVNKLVKLCSSFFQKNSFEYFVFIKKFNLFSNRPCISTRNHISKVVQRQQANVLNVFIVSNIGIKMKSSQSHPQDNLSPHFLTFCNNKKMRWERG